MSIPKANTRIFLKISAYTCLLLMSGTMIYSGFTKVYDVFDFVESLRDYEYIPSTLHPYIGFSVPLIELIIGGCIWFVPFQRVAVYAYQGLIGLFVFVLLLHFGKYMPMGCGCFGSGNAETITIYTIVRDLLLFIPSWIFLIIKRWFE